VPLKTTTYPAIPTLPSELPTSGEPWRRRGDGPSDSIAASNRLATMTEPYYWHLHPNSDETFLVIEGRLSIEFESGSLELDPGQLLTIPSGVRHRTRPVGARSVNLTFELAQSETVAV
jgi:mannose-6-phosphate isomerase-like protein (cupin superfamily)